MTSKSPDTSNGHALTLRVLGVEIAGRGLGILGVIAVVGLALLVFRFEIAKAVTAVAPLRESTAAR